MNSSSPHKPPDPNSLSREVQLAALIKRRNREVHLFISKQKPAQQGRLRAAAAAAPPTIFPIATFLEILEQPDSEPSSNTTAVPEPRKVLPLKATTRLNNRSKKRTTLLGLPGEIRNQIYYYLVANYCFVTNTKGPQILRASHPLVSKLRSFAIGTLTFLEVCRQIRSELTSLLQDHSIGTSVRSAHIVDYKFHDFLEHLKAYPPLKTPCKLQVFLDVTAPDSLDYQGLSEWLEACEPTSNGPAGFAHHMIHGVEYCVCIWAVSGSPHSAPDEWRKLSKMLTTMRHFEYNAYLRRGVMLNRIACAFKDWRLATPVGQQLTLYKYALFAWRPKRYPEDSGRQEKRRKLIEESEWEIDEGYDIFGGKDVKYESLLEDMEAWSIGEKATAGSVQEDQNNRIRLPLKYRRRARAH